jgi:cation transport ATPase
MAAKQQMGITYQSAGAAHEQRRPIADLALQRRAMGSMLLAMLVMLLGLPLHLAGLPAHTDHGGAAWLVVWLTCLLTLWTIWIVRHVLNSAWRMLRRRSFGSTELVTICALAAFVASCPALLDHRAPMYFDVTAMALAWIVAGEAQAAAIHRRFAAMLEQLAPLRLQPQPPALPSEQHSEQTARRLGVVILAFAIAALVVQVLLGGSLALSWLAGLAAVAAGCPCTLGIARTSAWQTGVERAAVLGWLIPSGAAFSRIAAMPDLAAQYAVRIGAADLGALSALAHSVERTLRWNILWAIGLNLLLLPLALFGPLPSLVPAATMLVARLLLFCTTQVQSR